MRAIVSFSLCFIFILLSVPGYAFADNRAKEEFTSNYLQFLERSTKLQSSIFDNLLDKTVLIHADASVTECSIDLPDGSNVIITNFPCEATLDLAIDLEKLRGHLSFDGLFFDDSITGDVYLREDGIILTRETIGSLYDAGLDTFRELGDLQSLPPYVLYEWDIDKAGLDQEMADVIIMTEKSDEWSALVQEVLSIIPDNCFYYSQGYAVLELKHSNFTSIALLNNLKKNKEKLADKYIATIPQYSFMNNEDYNLMLENAKKDIITAIDDISIKDLMELASDLGISIDELTIYSSRYTFKTEIQTTIANEEFGTMIIAFNEKSQLKSNYIETVYDIKLNCHYLDQSIDTITHSNFINYDNNATFNLILDTNINIPDEGDFSGTANINLVVDLSSKIPITLPVLTEDNSIKKQMSAPAEEDDLLLAPDEDMY